MTGKSFATALMVLLSSLLAGCGSATPAASPATAVAALRSAERASVTRRPPSASGWIYVNNWTLYNGEPQYLHMLEFASEATGNVQPARFRSHEASAVDSAGEFWATKVTNFTNYAMVEYGARGNIIGEIGGLDGIASLTVDRAQNVYALVGTEVYGTSCDFSNPVVREYAAGAYGKNTKVLRSFKATGLPFPVQCDSTIAVDGNGDTYVATNDVPVDWTGSEIQEYAPETSGAVRRMRTITFDGNATTIVNGIAGDDAGNLYALLNSTLVEYPAGSKRSQPLISGLNIISFALDSKADIYALVKSSSGAYSVDFFPHGSTTPTRVITGPRTRLTDPTSIVVSL